MAAEPRAPRRARSAAASSSARVVASRHRLQVDDAPLEQIERGLSDDRMTRHARLAGIGGELARRPCPRASSRRAGPRRRSSARAARIRGPASSASSTNRAPGLQLRVVASPTGRRTGRRRRRVSGMPRGSRGQRLGEPVEAALQAPHRRRVRALLRAESRRARPRSACARRTARRAVRRAARRRPRSPRSRPRRRPSWRCRRRRRTRPRRPRRSPRAISVARAVASSRPRRRARPRIEQPEPARLRRLDECAVAALEQPEARHGDGAPSGVAHRRRRAVSPPSARQQHLERALAAVGDAA